VQNNTLYLVGEPYPTIMYAPKILFRFISPTHLHIDDILMKHNNVGNGSVAMRALLDFAKRQRIQTITGALSSVDSDHQARRDHFYKKHGFSISQNAILKKLDGEEKTF